MADPPSQPDEASLDELLALADRLRAHPENARGADKTWVLDQLRSMQSFFRDAALHGYWLDRTTEDARDASPSAGPKPRSRM